MRVLWVFDSVSAQLQRVAADLARRPDVSLEIMCHYGKRPPVEESVATVTRLKCRGKIDMRAQRTIREKIRSGSFDIVHAYTSRNLSNVLGACRGVLQPPKVVGYRGTINQLSWFDPGNYLTFWHPRVAKIICVCQATQCALQASRISASKLATVWEGCDRSALPTSSREDFVEFGIPQDAFVVGAVANWRPVKGLDLLLQAARQLTDLKNIHWLVVGEIRDPRIPELASDPRIADRTHLVGPRSAGGRFTGLMDVYASPSRMEGLSMSIMEAMAQEVSVVVSDVGGNTELIRDEVDGLVVPTEDSAALAGAIRRLHDSSQLRQRLVRSARQRIESQFNVPNWTERLYAVYGELALGKTGMRQAA